MRGDAKALHRLAGTEAVGGRYCSWRGTEAKAPMFGLKPRPHLSWRKIDLFVRLRPPPVATEFEQEEERCLEAMLHWHDPVERSRTLRCRRHTLVDDNPTSG
jgi:hypothetical protein